MKQPDKIINTSGVGTVAGKSLVVGLNSQLKRIWGRNKSAATFYLHFIDSKTLPADGAVTHKINPIKVDAGLEFNADFVDLEIIFIQGMCIYASSTELTKTLVIADDMVATAIYITAN